jgi:hypothetical protein
MGGADARGQKKFHVNLESVCKPLLFPHHDTQDSRIYLRNGESETTLPVEGTSIVDIVGAGDVFSRCLF